MMRNLVKRFSLGMVMAVSSGALFAGDHVNHDAAFVDTKKLDGKVVFTQCAACHLATGGGVKGAFPPLRNRLSALSSTAQGRLYLQSVLLQGLNGKISVAGVNYNGYMQSYGNILNDQQISSVLNYVAIELTDDASAKFTPYSASEVAAARTLLKAEGRTSNERRKDAID